MIGTICRTWVAVPLLSLSGFICQTSAGLAEAASPEVLPASQIHTLRSCEIASSDPSLAAQEVFPSALGTFEAIPTDPDIANWWFYDTDPTDGLEDFPELSTLGLKEFWSVYDGTDHSEVIVVLFDTGIDTDNSEFKADISTNGPEDFSSRIVLFESFSGEGVCDPPFGFLDETSPRDTAGHGTAMAGIISAIPNAQGSAGIAYDNPLWVFKVGSNSGGNLTLDLDHLLNAMDELALRVAQFPDKRFVASMSLGFEEHVLSSQDKANLHSRVSALHATNKVIVVAAAGNEEDAFWADDGFPNPPICVPPVSGADWKVKYPAAFSGCHLWPDYDSVIAVGAVRLFESSAESECECNGPSTSATGRGWSEYSRFVAPEPGHPSCSPIIDVLAPGGARTNQNSSDPSCEGLNVFSTELCGTEDCAAVPCSLFGYNWGTSYSTAITSAVVAGIWSRDISLQPGDVKDIIMTYADRTPVHNGDNGISGDLLEFGTANQCDEIPPNPNDVNIGKLGSENEIFEFSGKAGGGVLNAGRAIRQSAVRDVEYVSGGTLDADLTLANKDAFVLANTITVASGTTLTIGPGIGSLQPVLVEGSTSTVEVVVEGTLVLAGDVSFATYDRDTDVGTWKGITVAPGGSLVTNGHLLRIRNADVGLTVKGSVDAANIDASYCRIGIMLFNDISLVASQISNCIGGINWAASADATLTNCSLADISGDAVSNTIGGVLSITGSSITDVAGSALDVHFASLTVEGQSVFTNTAGVIVSNLAPGSVLRDMTISSSTLTPLIVSGGDQVLGPELTINGSGPGRSGLLVTGSAVVAGSGLLTVENCDVEGILVVDSVLVGTWEVVSRFNGANGMKIDGASVVLGQGTKLSGNGSNGLQILDGSATVTDARLNSNGVAGLSVDGTAFAEVSASELKSNTIGVAVNANATADLGTGVSGGENDISGNSFKHVSNLNSSTTVQAESNFWGSCPPKATKFIGQVNYADPECTPP